MSSDLSAIDMELVDKILSEDTEDVSESVSDLNRTVTLTKQDLLSCTMTHSVEDEYLRDLNGIIEPAGNAAVITSLSGTPDTGSNVKHISKLEREILAMTKPRATKVVAALEHSPKNATVPIPTPRVSKDKRTSTSHDSCLESASERKMENGNRQRTAEDQQDKEEQELPESGHGTRNNTPEYDDEVFEDDSDDNKTGSKTNSSSRASSHSDVGSSPDGIATAGSADDAFSDSGNRSDEDF